MDCLIAVAIAGIVIATAAIVSIAIAAWNIEVYVRRSTAALERGVELDEDDGGGWDTEDSYDPLDPTDPDSLAFTLPLHP